MAIITKARATFFAIVGAMLGICAWLARILPLPARAPEQEVSIRQTEPPHALEIGEREVSRLVEAKPVAPIVPPTTHVPYGGVLIPQRRDDEAAAHEAIVQANLAMWQGQPAAILAAQRVPPAPVPGFASA
jgi:hypothetical protein